MFFFSDYSELGSITVNWGNPIDLSADKALPTKAAACHLWAEEVREKGEGFFFF
jgi:hypothetical protein